MRTPLVAAVIPVRNRREKTLRFLASLAVQTWPRLLPVVVDSNSSDGTLAAVQSNFPWMRTVAASGNDFWTGATNKGIRAALKADADYILTINDDSIVREGLVEDLVQIARHYDYPILGCRIDFLARPGLIWSLGASHSWATSELFSLNYNGCREEDLPEIIRDAVAVPVESTPGNGVLVHRRVFEKVGLYDDRNTPHYHADTEFLLRCRKHNFTPRIAPKIIVYNDAEPPSEPGMSAAPPPLTFSRLRHGVWFIGWMLTKKKSHFFFRPHAYVVKYYCPKGQRLLSLMHYLVGVFCFAFSPQWAGEGRDRARKKRRQEQLALAIQIVSGVTNVVKRKPA